MTHPVVAELLAACPKELRELLECCYLGVGVEPDLFQPEKKCTFIDAYCPENVYDEIWEAEDAIDCILRVIDPTAFFIPHQAEFELEYRLYRGEPIPLELEAVVARAKEGATCR